MVAYTDEEGWEQVQLAFIGDNNVHLLSGRVGGTSQAPASGPAKKWLKHAIFERLGLPQSSEETKKPTAKKAVKKEKV